MDDNRDDEKKEGSARGDLIKIDKERLNTHLDQIVRGTVEETLNGLLDAEADHLCQARRYERVDGRKEVASRIFRTFENCISPQAGWLTLVASRIFRTFENCISPQAGWLTFPG